jgi:very-short-patch-repair endonuclease
MRERIKQTSLETYGTPCSLQNPEVAQKSYETRIKNDSFNSSAGEKELRQFIQDIVSDVSYNDRNIIAPYELDIVIPQKNIAIEYNGLYYHSEAHKDKNYHAMKLARCNAVGYRLVTIFEHEWLERKNAVKSRLRAILGCNSNIIGARKTEVSVATVDEVLPFLNEFHIQGGVRFEKAFKLTYKGIIVAVMTLARHHRQTSKELILNRFCVRDNYTVIGGIAKLLKSADIKEPLVSYSDDRWSEGDIYQRLNFKLEAQIQPDYFYFNKSGIFSKQSKKKTKEEAALGISEHELRLSQGYLRVYDCGKKRWRLV